MPYHNTYWFRTRHLRWVDDPGAREYRKEVWGTELSIAKITKEDLNRLVMNFLIIEGFQDSATKFLMETGIEHMDLRIFAVRLAVKHTICRGDVQNAVIKINQLNPQLLEESSPLYFPLLFHFQQQKVIEHIRNKRIGEAVELAEKMLAPMVNIDATLLPELQRTLMLLLREDVSNRPMEELLDMSRHLMVASFVDGAILCNLGYEKESQLQNLVRTLIRVQNDLDLSNDLPYIQNFKTCEMIYQR